MIFERDWTVKLKGYISIVITFTIIFHLSDTITSKDWLVALIAGILMPVVDGLLWGKECWDDHPAIYGVVLAISILMYPMYATYSDIELFIFFCLGLLTMQSYLYYSGKYGKNLE